MNDQPSCDDDVKRCECNTFQQNEARDLQADFMLHVRAISEERKRHENTIHIGSQKYQVDEMMTGYAIMSVELF